MPPIRVHLALIILSASLLGACGRGGDSSSPATSSPAQSLPSAASEDQRLTAFLDEIFERNVRQRPEFQAALGRKTEDYGRWDDHSEAWAVARNAQVKEDLQELRASFDPEALSPDGRISYRVFEYDLQSELRAFPWRRHEYAVSQMDNIASQVPAFLQNLHTVDTRQDARDYVERLIGVETVMSQYVERLRLGEAAGVVPPMMVYPRALPAARNMLTGAPFDESTQDSILLADFRNKVQALDLTRDDEQKLLDEAVEALSGPFRRGYEALIAEIVRLERIADDNNGVWDLPDGADYYAQRIQHATTLPLPVEEIHVLGLAEVARIRAEMEAIMTEAGFDGDLQAFFEFIRNDPDNYFPDTDAGREAYIREAKALIDGIYAIAGDYFNVLPEAPLEIRRVEPWREKGSSTAFYNRPSADGSRPGIYYINQQNMNAVQKHIMNSLAYHEGAPGHHFQLAIQQELEGIPQFRKYAGYIPYVEGWALYSERLAWEAGLYEGLPLRDFGRLAEEMKRAVRLVVDTGMHAMRWTREECIEYMTANTPMAPADIERQIERYFVMPGQALGYKIGMIRILELRTRAEAALGDAYDIREFHDAVLKNGAMPMGILEQVVEEYIESVAGETT
jgi:uncharacterized protein (DUF885 family)